MSLLGLTRVAFGCAAFGDIAIRQRPLLQGEGADPHVRLTSRRIPRRDLRGGAIFWIIRHTLVARQGLLGISEEADAEGSYAAFRLAADVQQITPRQYRAHQGWRYLEAADWPEVAGPGGAPLPAGLAAELAGLALI